MLWLPLALLTALCESLKDVFGKISLQNSDVYIVSFALRLFALPFLIPVLFFIEIPALNATFYFAVVTGGLMNVLITVLYMKAIKASDLSVTVPMVTFTPLFLLLTSPLILGEFPNIYGLAGVLFIVFGAYMMHIKHLGKGRLMQPFRLLLSEKGPRLMLLVAFLWSITANIDKVGIINSSPMFYVVAVSVFLAFAMFILALIKSYRKLGQIKTHAKNLWPIGFFTAATLIFQMIAISLTLVAYVIAIKRSSALLSVLWGLIFFKEKNISERLWGTLVMLLGVLLIAFFNQR